MAELTDSRTADALMAVTCHPKWLPANYPVSGLPLI
ncbi:MAG: hypothetical protein RL444_1949 [Verrucomicrobiota bacterium]|jgi:hypothetical protein